MNHKQFLLPSKWKLALFIFFLLIDYFGQVQSWVFCKECYPKPFLYDLISAIDFWTISLVISAPVRIIELFLPKTGLAYAFSTVLLIAYFYVLTSAVIFIAQKIKNRPKTTPNTT